MQETTKVVFDKHAFITSELASLDNVFQKLRFNSQFEHGRKPCCMQRASSPMFYSAHKETIEEATEELFTITAHSYASFRRL